LSESREDKRARLAQAIGRGQRASAIFEDPLFVEGVEAVRDECIRTFRNSTPDETPLREEAYFKHRALTDVVRQLQNPVRSAELAQEELARMNAEEAQMRGKPGESREVA
tara:strand:- start:10356 stop:10685 length:330 start_codon:yes stop_codon:yes gene_type:complete